MIADCAVVADTAARRSTGCYCLLLAADALAVSKLLICLTSLVSKHEWRLFNFFKVRTNHVM